MLAFEDLQYRSLSLLHTVISIQLSSVWRYSLALLFCSPAKSFVSSFCLQAHIKCRLALYLECPKCMVLAGKPLLKKAATVPVHELLFTLLLRKLRSYWALSRLLRLFLVKIGNHYYLLALLVQLGPLLFWSVTNINHTRFDHLFYSRFAVHAPSQVCFSSYLSKFRRCPCGKMGSISA